MAAAAVQWNGSNSDPNAMAWQQWQQHGDGNCDGGG